MRKRLNVTPVVQVLECLAIWVYLFMPVMIQSRPETLSRFHVLVDKGSVR